MRNGNSTYNFDQIGNRVDAAVPAALSSPAGTFDYISNSLNQYTSITDLPSPISDLPTHDLDGNLLDDGKGTTFTWNAENRMITATKGNTLVENTYDSQGRRVRKKVNVSGVTQKDLRFFYDGWNLLYELDTERVDPTRYYVWGLDLSQSMQGAGGVGGLLFTTTTTAAHAISYDANGNISEYIDLADGSIDAHLEYDAFGRIIASTGTAPSSFGFSTNYQDTETGYLYYGFRYYDPETGRWPNRDPIGERGGLNVYAFVMNDGVNVWDFLGLQGHNKSCGTLCGGKRLKAMHSCCNNEQISQRNSGCCNGTKFTKKNQCCISGQVNDYIPAYEAMGISESECINSCSLFDGTTYTQTAAAGGSSAIATAIGKLIAGGSGATIGGVGVGAGLVANTWACISLCNQKVCPNWNDSSPSTGNGHSRARR